MTILLSLDGKPSTQTKYRPLKEKRRCGTSASLAKTLKDLQDRKMSFFVNLVYTEKNLKDLFENVAFLVKKGVRDIQLTYAIGSKLKEKDALSVHKILKKIFQTFPQVNFFGCYGENEPILATPQITVDSNGDIYRGCALVLEKNYPDFNGLCRVGTLDNITNFSVLQKTINEQTGFLLDSQHNIPLRLMNNLYFGLALKKSLSLPEENSR